MKRLKNKGGVIFVTALTMMIVLLLLGTAFLLNVRSETEININQLSALKALYAAEAGVEHVYADLLKNGIRDVTVDDVDLDGDGATDYTAGYSTETGLITSEGVHPTIKGTAKRTVTAAVKPEGFVDALGTGRYFMIAETFGNINGQITYGDPTMGGDIPGTINHEGNTRFKIGAMFPDPDFDGFKAAAAAADPEKVIEKEDPEGEWDKIQAEFVSAPPSGDGLYFIDGDLTIKGAGFNLQGSLIVNGSLYIDHTADNLTITAPEGWPAIVAQNMYARSCNEPNWEDCTSLDNVVINGLVYSKGMSNINACDGFTVNGALIAAEHNQEMYNITNFQLDYNEDLDPAPAHFKPLPVITSMQAKI